MTTDESLVRNGQELKEEITANHLREIFRGVKYEDQKLRGDVVEIKELADVKLVGDYLEMFISAVEGKDQDCATRIAFKMEPYIGDIEELDNTLWPVLEKFFEQQFKQPLPKVQEMPFMHDPKKTVVRLETENKLKQLSDKASGVMGFLAKHKKAIATPLLTVISIMGVVKGTGALDKEVPEGPAQDSDKVYALSDEDIDSGEFDNFLKAIGRGKEIQDDSDGKSFDEFTLELNNLEQFNKSDINKLIADSIKFNPESWGMEFTEDSEELEPTIERVQTRVWEGLMVFGGVHDNDIEEIKFKDRQVRASSGFKVPSKEVDFSADEQKKLFNQWLSEQKSLLVQDLSNFDNYTDISEGAMGSHVGAKAIGEVLEQNIPWGFLHVDSGYRSPAHQKRVILRKAEIYGFDTSQDVAAIVQQLRAKGEKVAMPGTSAHEKGLAVDVGLADHKYYKLFDYFAGYMDKVITDNTDLDRQIKEYDNGRSGCCHVEGTQAFVDQAVEQDKQQDAVVDTK